MTVGGWDLRTIAYLLLLSKIEYVMQIDGFTVGSKKVSVSAENKLWEIHSYKLRCSIYIKYWPIWGIPFI